MTSHVNQFRGRIRRLDFSSRHISVSLKFSGSVIPSPPPPLPFLFDFDPSEQTGVENCVGGTGEREKLIPT